MTEYVYYVNAKTGKIKGKYCNCDTNSPKYRNDKFIRVESPNNLPRGYKLFEVKK